MTNKNISHKSGSALIWNYLGTSIRMLSQFLIGIILARLLGPEAFGIVAIGFIMVGVGNLIADLGLSAALIQSRTLEKQDMHFIFTVQVIMGAVFSTIGIIAADPIALFFNQQDAKPFIQAMSCLFLLQSFGQSSGAMLRRDLNFKTFQTLNVSSYLAGYLLVGIPCAVFGFGAWSLVVAQLIQSATFSLLVVGHSKHTLRPAFKPMTSGIFFFGARVILADLTSWAIHTLPSIIIGRVLGVVSLGVYNRATVLVGTPINTLTTSLQGVLFAASSKLQNDSAQLKKAFLAATALTGFICLPLVSAIACVPSTVINSVYGQQWQAAIPILTPIALAMGMHALLAVVGPVLMAQNKVRYETRAQIIVLCLMMPILYILAGISLVAFSWGMLCMYFLRWLLLIQAVLPTINTKWSELILILRWPVICAITAATLVLFCDITLNHLSPILLLICDVAIAAIALIVIGKVFGKNMLDGPHGELLLSSGRLPIKFRRFFGI